MASANTIKNPNQMIPSAESSQKTLDSYARVMEEQAMEEKILVQENVVNVDLSSIRGIQPPPENELQDEQEGRGGGGGGGSIRGIKSPQKHIPEEDLEALSELVPGLKMGQVGALAVQGQFNGHGNMDPNAVSPPHHHKDREEHSPDFKKIPHLDSMMVNQGLDEEYANDDQEQESLRLLKSLAEGDKEEDDDGGSDDDHDSSSESSEGKTVNDLIESYQKTDINKKVVQGALSSSSSSSSAGQTHASATDHRDAIPEVPMSQNGSQNGKAKHSTTSSSKNNNNNSNGTGVKSIPNKNSKSNSNHNNISKANPNPYHNAFHDEEDKERLPGTPPRDSNNIHDDSYYGTTPSPHRGEFYPQSSAQSLSTATQSHEVRMPMYLPNFRPATGCTNASDFIVRCFVARLRAGITVVKHGRSRWCKSRLRVLHVHSDGRSLSWRPAQGEPASNKRPPKLDLSTCLEVRHAWSPDPLNPMFTGTPILRSKCEASNAFKSFALIFPRRTVDITAVTADQCKVLMEGFSALCFRLQVANMAGRKQGMVPTGGEGEGDGNHEKAERMSATTSPPTTSGTGPF
jgi:hypothetical protein